MSKYFDETVKLNSSTTPLGSPARSVSQRVTNEQLPGQTSSSRGFDLDLRKDQRISIALSRALRQEFAQCGDLETFQESFRVLRTRLLRLQSKRGLRSVVVTSSTKGEGKSTVSLNLAFTCAQLPEMKVLLIDADIRGCGLSHLLGPPKGQGLPEVLLQKAELDEAILSTDLPNLYFLPCESTSIPPAELLASRRWSELIASCVETFSLVIVDAPPILNLTDADLISAPCDGVLMVARSHETRTDFIQKATCQIDSRKLIGVILNGTAAGPDTYTYGYNKPTPDSTPRPIPVVSRLFGRNDSDKNKDRSSAVVPPVQPATPSLPRDVARPTTPSQAASPHAVNND
jgi:capsular exopolysaccharide synthesis family protein